MRAKCIFLTGLPCSGKTTISNALKYHFPQVQQLDGDIIRDTPLGNDVGFSPEDRSKHILRMGYLSKLLVDQGVTTICSFVSPQKDIRDRVRGFFDPDQFVEVFLSTDVKICASRDVKGMYAKAYAGEIKNFTGVQAPYESPENPELILDTNSLSLKDCVTAILKSSGRTDERKKRWHWFFGRWNGVHHLGHEHIIKQPLAKNPENHVMLAIRDVEPDEKNPWPASEVKDMLDYCYANDPRIHTCIVPDITSVEYGRGVGYEVNEIKVTEKIAGISGTKCREMIQTKNPEWRKLVPERIAYYLEKKYSI
jgi:adenylylsulfate kinase